MPNESHKVFPGLMSALANLHDYASIDYIILTGLKIEVRCFTPSLGVLAFVKVAQDQEEFNALTAHLFSKINIEQFLELRADLLAFTSLERKEAVRFLKTKPGRINSLSVGTRLDHMQFVKSYSIIFRTTDFGEFIIEFKTFAEASAELQRISEYLTRME